jgi:uncharacterized protein (DUF1800 family)
MLTGIAALLLGVAGLGMADQSAPESSQSLMPLADSAWDYAKARHLLFRAGFGGPPEEVEKLHALGLRKAVDFLVDYKSQPDVDLPPPEPPKDEVTESTLRKLTPEERQKAQQQKRRNDQLDFQMIRQWWVKRLVESPRPLEEKLVLFWHGHFATEYRTVRNSQAMLRQNQLFREHAAGNFGKLLHGIVHDPAMLRYLDNNTNVKGKPNENLAREIMELFTMGEGQGYTEQDIKEAARALTGYTFDRETPSFRFAKFAHDTGSKTIFGKTGDCDGDQLVDLILQQPATPRFIARKLFVFFVHDEPSPATIEELASALQRSNYELAPFLKTLFLSQEFYSARAMGMQIKSPAQFVIGSLRTLPPLSPPLGKGGKGGYEPGPLVQAMRAMGQELMEPPNVKGWEGGQAWINTNTLFARDNFAALMIGTGVDAPMARAPRPSAPAKPGAKDERPLGPLAHQLNLLAPLQEQKLETATAIVDYYARVLFASPLREAKRSELIAFLGNLPPASQWSERQRDLNVKLGGLLILMMSLPEYQLT